MKDMQQTQQKISQEIAQVCLMTISSLTDFNSDVERKREAGKFF